MLVGECGPQFRHAFGPPLNCSGLADTCGLRGTGGGFRDRRLGRHGAAFDAGGMLQIHFGFDAAAGVAAIVTGGASAREAAGGSKLCRPLAGLGPAADDGGDPAGLRL